MKRKLFNCSRSCESSRWGGVDTGGWTRVCATCVDVVLDSHSSSPPLSYILWSLEVLIPGNIRKNINNVKGRVHKRPTKKAYTYAFLCLGCGALKQTELRSNYRRAAVVCAVQEPLYSTISRGTFRQNLERVSSPSSAGCWGSRKGRCRSHVVVGVCCCTIAWVKLVLLEAG